jgi:hypothetical protein
VRTIPVAAAVAFVKPRRVSISTTPVVSEERAPPARGTLAAAKIAVASAARRASLRKVTPVVYRTKLRKT